MYNKSLLKNNFKNLINFLLVILFFGVAIIGFENLLKSKGNSVGGPISFVLLMLISLVIGLVINTFVHELGHLLFGKLSKYKFVGFRVFNTMIVKIDGKLEVKNYNLPGTLGQCFMVRDFYSEGKTPYVMYLLGGSLLNFIFGTSLILVALFVTKLLIILRVAFFVIGLIGVYFCLNNIIPRCVKGLANDGYNIIRLKKSTDAQRIFVLELLIQELLISGKRYKDMPSEWFVLENIDSLDAENKFLAQLLLFNYLFDKQDFEKAKALGQEILKAEHIKLDISKKDLLCELLFIEIISHPEKDKIEELYDKDLKNHIKLFRYHLSKLRFLYSYARLISFDKEEAEHILRIFQQTCLTYPMTGEIESEKELIFLIDNISGKFREPFTSE